MSEFDEYSLSGCLIDASFQAPQLQSEFGSDPFSTTGAGAQPLPPVVDLRKYCSPVEDERKTGTCVANAVVGALELLQRREGHSVQDLSRLFVFYNSRKLHDSEPGSGGTFVNTAMAAIIAYGICEERMWPFSEITLYDEPTRACYENAENYRGVEFAELASDTPLTHVIARGIPVIIGVSLPREAYMAAHQTGVMQIPAGAGTDHDHGNHAMLVVGYDLEQRMYIVRNSWGERYAQGGYFMMPFAIFENSAMARQNWAIGSLGQAPGLTLLGKSVPDSVAGMVQAVQAAAAPQGQAGAQASAQAQDPGQGLRDEMQSDIDKARSGFASRLRNK